MGDAADDLIDAGFDSDYAPEPGDHFWCGSPRRKPLCTNAEISSIVQNIVARKNDKPIMRETLDKHVTEIAKIRFNHKLPPSDIELTIEDLQVKVASAESADAVDLYRRIALCAILLADAAENGKW